jgi:hypothetical protein
VNIKHILAPFTRPEGDAEERRQPPENRTEMNVDRARQTNSETKRSRDRPRTEAYRAHPMSLRSNTYPLKTFAGTTVLIFWDDI